MTGENWLLVFGVLVIGVAAMIFLPHDAPIPVPPVVDAGADVSVQESCSLRLEGRGYDPDGGPVEFLWTAQGGRGLFENPSDAETVYTAPEVCGTNEILELTLAATSEAGLGSSDSLLVHVCKELPVYPHCKTIPVLPGVSVVGGDLERVVCAVPSVPRNCSPYADAGGNISVQEGATVRLTCEGFDPDGDPVSFYWTADSGEFDNPCLLHPNYTAPLLDCEDSRDVPLTLIVTDSHGTSASDSIIARVTNVNRPPYADAGGNISVQEGATVRLTCAGSDPDGDPVSFYWTASSGRFDDPCALHPRYTAPLLDCETVRNVTLTLTVTDAHGASRSDSIVARVANVNRPPRANAGEDFSMWESSMVQLTCAGSDPDGDPVSFYWTASSGRFDNPCLLHPFYISPLLDCEGSREVILILTVTDGHGASTSDSAVITVQDGPEPECVPYYRLVVAEGERVRLSGRVGDSDGNLRRHLWQATAGQFDDPRSLCTVFTAPLLEPGESLREIEVALVAEDTCGLTSRDTRLILVTAARHPPHVDAGPDCLITETLDVQLAAQVYDEDGEAVEVVWRITQGCATLSNRTSSRPTLTFCPDAESGAEVAVALTGTDSQGSSTTDTIRVKLALPATNVECGDEPPHGANTGG